MRPLARRLCTLFVLVLVLGLGLLAGPSATAQAPPIEAWLTDLEGAGSQAQLRVVVHRPGVLEVSVVAFDKEGAPVGVYLVQPRYDEPSRAEVTVDVAPGAHAQVRSVRAFGFTATSSPVTELPFDSGAAAPVALSGCAGFCIAARRECSSSCWEGSGEAVFSCGFDPVWGGCVATCRCCEYPDCNGP